MKYFAYLMTAWAGAGLLLAAPDPSSPFFKADEVPPETINEAIGTNLFTTEPFWKEDEAAVAKRLGWPEESRTAEVASYRNYTGPEARLFGVRPYSCAFYARGGKPLMLSLVFTNKGDAFPADTDSWSYQDLPKEDRKAFEDALENDTDTIEAALNAVLGKPKRVSYGKGSMKEKAWRWDWRGVSFLLAAPDNEYVGLRIVSGDMADNDGVLEPVADAEFKRKLLSRVLKRDNGDVVITELPMVDQGPKGYCVPATWERYLRFMDIPADMYVLAMAAGTQAGGGTQTGVIDESAQRLARRHRKRIEPVKGGLEMKTVADYIDQGLPIMWTCLVDDRMDKMLYLRTREREGMEPEAWNARLEEVRGETSGFQRGMAGGHMRMIIGYNPKTNEIAFTDSWGQRFKERWMTIGEAQAIHADTLKVIEP